MPLVVHEMDVSWRIAAVIITTIFVGSFDLCLSYERPPARQTIVIPCSDTKDKTIPQQVHMSIVGRDKMRVTWITEKPTPTVVYYGTAPGVYEFHANGSSHVYTYMMYTSGEIHDAVIGPLKPNTPYYYRLGSNKSNKEYTLKTPPQQFPIKFAVAGDLGQSDWTKSTLKHISTSNYDVLILPGDLSYADTYQPFWDSFGRLVEPLASQRPWMVTQGNHEVEKIPIITKSFVAYNARWSMPYEESGSPSNLYYSFEVAGVHVIMLGSYADFGPDSPQYNWLVTDLKKVDRSKTPWLIALIHAPWYSSNKAHQGEDESVKMKEAMEELLYNARIDMMFAGHVHAYERFNRVYKDGPNECGPMHVTIGDGGNREGLARDYIDPMPTISTFREASFGHGQLEIVNVTHAQWRWHRNDDEESTVADSVWLTSLMSSHACRRK